MLPEVYMLQLTYTTLQPTLFGLTTEQRSINDIQTLSVSNNKAIPVHEQDH